MTKTYLLNAMQPSIKIKAIKKTLTDIKRNLKEQAKDWKDK